MASSAVKPIQRWGKLGTLSSIFIRKSIFSQFLYCFSSKSQIFHSLDVFNAMYIFSTFFFILFWGWTRHVVRRLCQAQLRSSNNCRIFFFWFLKCCENTISNKIDTLTNCFNQNTFLFQSLLKESFIFGLRFCFQYTWNGLSYSKTSKDPWSTCF